MKLLVNGLLTTTWSCMLISGCGRAPSPAVPNLGGPNGFITWTPVGKDNPVPVDGGSIYHLGTSFVLWSDAPGGGGGTSSSSIHGVKCQGNVLGRDGRRVEFHCET